MNENNQPAVSFYKEKSGAVRLRITKDIAEDSSFFNRELPLIAKDFNNIILSFLEVYDLCIDHELDLNFDKDSLKKRLLGEITTTEKRKKPTNSEINSSELKTIIENNNSLSESISELKDQIHRGVLLNSITFKWLYMINYTRTRLNGEDQDPVNLELLKNEESFCDSIVNLFFPNLKIPLRHRYFFNDLLSELNSKLPKSSNFSKEDILEEVTTIIESKLKESNDSDYSDNISH